jgi:hypothetical protein
MMPPVIRLVALMAVLAMLGAAGVLVYAGLQRYRGRPISRATVRLGAGLEGASAAIGFVFIPEWGFVAVFLAVPAYLAYRLLRRGHRIATGTLLMALGSVGAAWWGYYLVQDALDPFVSYEAILWLWWAPEVALLIVGAFLIARGDRVLPPAKLFTQTPTQVREPAAVGSAIMRAMMIGPIPISILVGVGAALTVVGFLLPLAVRAGVPWPVGLVAGAVAFAAIAVELGYLVIPPRLRRAWQGHALVAHPQTKRWHAMTGTSVPATLPAIRRWLERNPERPEARWARAEALIIAGDLAEARSVIERMPIDSDWGRWEQHALRVYVGWVEGADPDYAALQAHAETVGEPGSAERMEARGEAMIAVARDLAASGGDWMAPLIAYREAAGPVADRVLRNDLRRLGYRSFLVYGLVASGVVLLTTGLIP